MTVNTMRIIDKWVGIPLCFIISPFCWLSDLLRGARKKKPDTSRTLFIELSEMGSALIADPAMRKLRSEARKKQADTPERRGLLKVLLPSAGSKQVGRP